MGTTLFTEDLVRELSRVRKEPDWLLRHRLKALETSRRMPIETSQLYTKSTDLGGVSLDSIDPIRPSQAGAPEYLETLEEGAAEPSITSFDLNVKINCPEQLSSKGIIFTEISSAIRLYPERLKELFEHRSIPTDMDKFVALNHALFNSGFFLYVPKNIELDKPVRNLFFGVSPGIGVFSQSIIILEEGSKASLVEQLYSPSSPHQGQSLYSNITEAYLGRSASLSLSTIQNFSDNVNVFSNRKSVGGIDSVVNWNTSYLGGAVTRSRLDSLMNGQGSSAQDLEVVFGSKQEKFDLVSNLVHVGRDTTGRVIAKGALKDKSRLIAKGIIRIFQESKNTRAYLADHAILLSPEARADAIPALEIETDEVKATHSVSVAQVDAEQIFYLTTRGLSLDEARKVIVMGFFEPVIQDLPLREVKWNLRYLVEKKWSEDQPGPELTPRELMDLFAGEEAELEAPAAIEEIFAQHYKYSRVRGRQT